jgi:hypothetical protein
MGKRREAPKTFQAPHLADDESDNGQKRHQSCYCSTNSILLEKKVSESVRDSRTKEFSGPMGQKSKKGRLDKTLKGQDLHEAKKECFARHFQTEAEYLHKQEKCSESRLLKSESRIPSPSKQYASTPNSSKLEAISSHRKNGCSPTSGVKLL